MNGAKKLIIFLAVIDILAICGAAFAFHVHINSRLELKKNEINIEFGESIPLEASYYLKNSVDEDVIKNTKVAYQEDKVKGEDYDKIGKYTVKLTHKKETVKVSVSVVDTTKPKFNKINTIESITGVDIAWKDYIKAKDLSDFTLKIDDSEVNESVAGEYILTAIAEDDSGNKRKKEIKVVINWRPANMVDYSVATDERTGIVTVTAIIGNSYTNTNDNNDSTTTTQTDKREESSDDRVNIIVEEPTESDETVGPSESDVEQ